MFSWPQHTHTHTHRPSLLQAAWWSSAAPWPPPSCSKACCLWRSSWRPRFPPSPRPSQKTTAQASGGHAPPVSRADALLRYARFPSSTVPGRLWLPALLQALACRPAGLRGADSAPPPGSLLSGSPLPLLAAVKPYERPASHGLQYYSAVPGEDVVGQPYRHQAADEQVPRRAAHAVLCMERVRLPARSCSHLIRLASPVARLPLLSRLPAGLRYCPVRGRHQASRRRPLRRHCRLHQAPRQDCEAGHDRRRRHARRARHLHRQGCAWWQRHWASHRRRGAVCHGGWRGAGARGWPAWSSAAGRIAAAAASSGACRAVLRF